MDMRVRKTLGYHICQKQPQPALSPCQQFTLTSMCSDLIRVGEWFGAYWPLIDTSIYSAFTLLQKELIIFLLCLSYSHLLVIQVGSRCMVSFFISETQTEPHYLFIFCHRVAYYSLDCSLSVSLFISFAGREVTRSYCAVLLSPRWRDSEPAGSHSIRLIRDRVTPAMPRGCN